MQKTAGYTGGLLCLYLEFTATDGAGDDDPAFSTRQPQGLFASFTSDEFIVFPLFPPHAEGGNTFTDPRKKRTYPVAYPHHEISYPLHYPVKSVQFPPATFDIS